MEAKAPALLSVKDLRVEYLTPAGPVCAVDGVSFDIGKGEVLGLAGESGSGKSTVAQALLRILRPPAVITGGQVLFEGEDVLAMSEAQLRQLRWRKISLVFQSAMNSLNPILSIGEQIVDAIQAHLPMKRPEALDRAVALLKLVGIDSSRLTSYPHQLSGGMRQRVVIAIALALEPPLMLMDEPTTALDVVVQKEILHQVSELKEKLGFSILFITHDLSLILEFSTRIAVLYAGKLMEMAPSRELYTAPKHPYTQGLLGSVPSVRGPRRKLVGIPGSPPDMRRLPSGCRFHPRCPSAMDQCKATVPELRQLGPDHIEACHLDSQTP
ncbi:peptide/nickel transport system ATP-binding protein [Stigmatella aurantiaca]|uniref:Peptide/nickel transport system ATP-binding protein n=1 Tax=Stigmatella aurantiaca TaxID=41 RepID=A0A1H7UZV6_STIAU|nr:ABC transporter ATP-binding protein [Stigmatella aurantiaca]SEM02396.1 peptide/nickel transport system ATP-binding protein [Stigmatella aurantiaca]